MAQFSSPEQLHSNPSTKHKYIRLKNVKKNIKMYKIKTVKTICFLNQCIKHLNQIQQLRGEKPQPERQYNLIVKLNKYSKILDRKSQYQHWQLNVFPTIGFLVGLWIFHNDSIRIQIVGLRYDTGIVCFSLKRVSTIQFNQRNKSMRFGSLTLVT